MKNNVLDNFEKLMKGDQNIVIKSTVFILKHLSETGENELNYSLTRLIRGLGGTKPKVQSNYFTTLVAIFNTLKNIQPDNLFNIINKMLQTSSSNTKGENADICTGQILICGAIVRSPIFEKMTIEDQRKVLTMIFEAGKQRSYLKLEANIFFIDVLRKINERQYMDLLHPIIKEDILKDIAEQDQDSLHLLLCCVQQFPGKFKKKTLQQFIGSSTIICEENMKAIANILMNTRSVRCVKHPIYDIVLEKITRTCLYKFLDEFDANLLKPNYNRHLTAAHILRTILQKLEDFSSIQLLFTKNFMSHTMHYFKTKKSNDDLAKYLQNLFKTLVEKLQSNANSSDNVIFLLKKLLFWPGSLTFDQTTKSNTVNDIINNMNGDGIKKVIEMYKEIVVLKNQKQTDNDGYNKWLNSERLLAANSLTRLLRHPNIADDIEFRQSQINGLMDISLFKNDCIGLELATSLKKSFYSALDQKFSKLEYLCSVLSHLLYNLEAKLQDEHTNQLLQPMQDSTKDVWLKTLKMIKKFEKKKKKQLNTVFYTMFLLMGLQLFQQPKLAEGCLNELFHCCHRIKGKKKTEDVEGDGEEPVWIEVVIDLFLNLLSQNSHLLRNMIGCVFPHLCKHLTTSAIHQILYVLDSKNDENPLKDYGIYDEDDDEIEQCNGNEDDEEESSSEKDEDGDEEDVYDEDETVNDKLRLALQQALRGKETETDDESVNLDEMSDGEGIELDKALSAVFKQYKPNTGKRTNKQQAEDCTLTHFRVRVLDLIKTYINTNPSMLIAIEILLPLLHLLEFSIRETHQTPLHVPLKKCIEKMSQVKKFSDIDGVDESTLIDLLKSLMEKGTRNVNVMKDMDEEFSNACVFVLRCVQFYNNSDGVSKKSRKKLKEIYKILCDELNDYFAKRDGLTPYVLWKDIIGFDFNISNNLVPTLVKNAFNDDIKLFKRSQAIQLLNLLYSNNRLMTTITDAEKETLVNEFLEKSDEFLTNLNTKTIDCLANEKFIATLFNCLSILKKSVPLNSVIDENVFTRIGELIREIRSKVSLSSNCLTQYKMLCKSLGVNRVVTMNNNLVNLGGNKKEDVEENEVNGNESPTKKKKRKKINEEEQTRKKRKIERMKLLSEGMHVEGIHES